MQGTNGSRKQRDRYRIVVRDEFGDLLTAAFEDVAVSAGGGKTVLTASARSPQELSDLLDRLRDHGVQIEKVSQIDELD